MTHTESLIKDYEAALRVMKTLPNPDIGRSGVINNDYYQIGCESQRNADLAELRRRLAVMKQWRPGVKFQHKYVGENAGSSEPWYDSSQLGFEFIWDQFDYRPAPAPEPPKPPGVVWIRPLGLLHGQTSDPFQVIQSAVKPDGPGWTRYVAAPEGGGV